MGKEALQLNAQYAVRDKCTGKWLNRSGLLSHYGSPRLYGQPQEAISAVAKLKLEGVEVVEVKLSIGQPLVGYEGEGI